ncbi:MAG: MFS transporter [Caldilineaceae bacterium]|nr:MFS transporter [Caldilineaceae bacterium]
MAATTPQGTTTNGQRWLYALTMLGLQIPVQVFNVSLLFFYTDVKRLPPQWTATALTLYAIYNAVNNPLIGYLSDRTSTRWGRRLPYLWFGTVPWIVIFALLWLAPFNGNEQPIALLIYMVIGIVLYDGIGTAVNTAYYSLMPEMFATYHERTDVAVRMNIFLTVALLAGVALPPMIAERLSWGTMGLIFAVVALIATYAGYRGMFERGGPSVSEDFSFFTAFKATFVNRSFLPMTVAQTMRFVTTNALSTGMIFYVKYSLGADAGQTTIILATAFVTAAAALYPWRLLIANRFEARTTALCGYAATALAAIPLWFVNTMTGAVIASLFIGIAFAGIFLMDNVLISDVIDEDEVKTGQRREGMYFGLNGLVVTLSAAIVSIVFGIVAPAYGYDTRLEVQPDTVATGFRVFMTGLPFIGCALAFLALLTYPLPGARLREVKATLETRRAATSTPVPEPVLPGA